MKALLSALSVGLALMVMGTSASAVPFSYRFESQLLFPFGAFAAAGDTASITVTLDNGGASVVNQVWTAADLVSVAFDINNGAATADFFSPFDGGLTTAVGGFATDAAGTLISAPTDWDDRNVTADFVTSFPFNGNLNWVINGDNAVLFDLPLGLLQLRLADVDGITNPANWTLVTQAVPLSLPSTLLLLLVGLGGVALLRRAPSGERESLSGKALRRVGMLRTTPLRYCAYRASKHAAMVSA